MLAAYSQYGFAAAGDPLSANQRWRMGPVPASTMKGAPTVVSSTSSSQGMGAPPPAGAASPTASGSARAAASISARCTAAWRRTPSARVVRCAHR